MYRTIFSISFDESKNLYSIKYGKSQKGAKMMRLFVDMLEESNAKTINEFFKKENK